jgi:hypothetical protein
MSAVKVVRRMCFIRIFFVCNKLIVVYRIPPDVHILDKLKINKNKVSLKFRDLIICFSFSSVPEVSEKSTSANEKVQNNTRDPQPLIIEGDGIFRIDRHRACLGGVPARTNYPAISTHLWSSWVGQCLHCV